MKLLLSKTQPLVQLQHRFLTLQAQKLKPKEQLQAKIGLEIHARILAKTKIFSDASYYDLPTSPANINVSYVDAALPGTMPTLNKRSVEAGVLTALALNCKLNSVSHFERKHYFYADLPAGYQITQQKQPLAVNGLFRYPVKGPGHKSVTYKECRIRRIQLEHDSARTVQVNDMDLVIGNEHFPKNSTLIDLNRSGMGLMEIVTEPDFDEAVESYSFARELAFVLRVIGTCDGAMGLGGFRVDVNVSVHEMLDNGLLGPGTRVELKNLNNFSDVLKGTTYEIERQKRLVQEGKQVELETRSYNSATGKTVKLRSKEEQWDYRFMPEPNLPPLVIVSSSQNAPELIDPVSLQDKDTFFVDIDNIKADFKTKTLPQTRRNILVDKFGLNQETAFRFTAYNLDHVFLKIMSLNGTHVSKAKCDLIVSTLLNECMNEVQKVENEKFVNFGFDLKCAKINEYVNIVLDGKIVSRLIYDKLFVKMFDDDEFKNKMPLEIVKELNWFLITDEKRIKECLEEHIKKHPEQIKKHIKDAAKPKKKHIVTEFFTHEINDTFNKLTDKETVRRIVAERLQTFIDKK